MKFRSRHKPDFKHQIIRTIICMRKNRKKVPSCCSETLHECAGLGFVPRLFRRESEIRTAPRCNPMVLKCVFLPCSTCFDRCSHTYGGIYEKETFNLPHQDYSKLRIEKHPKSQSQILSFFSSCCFTECLLIVQKQNIQVSAQVAWVLW